MTFRATITVLMNATAENSSPSLADQLLNQSEHDAAVTPMDAAPSIPKMQDIHHMYEVIEHECTGCGDCLPYCPEPER